jgi:hypothetical protein
MAEARAITGRGLIDNAARRAVPMKFPSIGIIELGEGMISPVGQCAFSSRERSSAGFFKPFRNAVFPVHSTPEVDDGRSIHSSPCRT